MPGSRRERSRGGFGPWVRPAPSRAAGGSDAAVRCAAREGEEAARRAAEFGIQYRPGRDVTAAYIKSVILTP